jgi:3-dehydroquinate synthase
MVRVTVDVPGHGYDVVIGAGLLGRASDHLPALPRAEKLFVVADGAVAPRYLEPLSAGLAGAGLDVVNLLLPRGEEAKTLSTMTAILHQLAMQEAHRDDVVFALGGGAVGDLAGFVAATYMRGVRFVQVPTTLTAQVDAAVGGKTGVNLPEGKNLVGAFHQPVAVIADVLTLSTLPERELRSGLAEVAKYGLTSTPALLTVLRDRVDAILARDPVVMEELVVTCVRAKAEVVSEDERDAGGRMVLNYGHTVGHALERLDAFTGRSHGEAIAMGMLFAARVAEAMGLAGPGLVERHREVLAPLGLEPGGALPPGDEILAAMRMDKKFGSGIRLVLLQDVARPAVVDAVPEDVVLTALKELGAEG